MENSAVIPSAEEADPKPHRLQVIMGGGEQSAGGVRPSPAEEPEIGLLEEDADEVAAPEDDPEDDFAALLAGIEAEPEPEPGALAEPDPLADPDLDAEFEYEPLAEFESEPSFPSAPAADGISASDVHGQAILAAVNAAIDSLRDRFAAEAAATEKQAREQADSARAETEETVGQLTLALDQIRHLRGQIDELSRHSADQAKIGEAMRTMEARLAEETAKNAELQERLKVVADGRSAAEEVAAKARAAAEVARREAASLSADLAAIRDGFAVGLPGAPGKMPEIGTVAAVNALMPVQITAVADVMAVEERKTGVGIVFDIRIAAAMPLDMTHTAEPIQSAIDHIVDLAHAMHPTAVITLAFGSAEDHEEAARRHPGVTFVAPPDADDRRQKAAHVLAAAARNLSQ
jgi:hypothetical protein